nr:hypothetical protein [uncultured Anaeromusa sp.]
MSHQVEDFYQPLGFEIIEFSEDGPTLCYEPVENDQYAILTTEEGLVPESLEEKVIFSYYCKAGAFRWHVEFENSQAFAEVWPSAATPAERFAAMEELIKKEEA